MLPGLILTLAFLAAVSLLVLRKPQYFKSQQLKLLRVFFPSWRFFDFINSVPLLYVRSWNEKGEWSEWLPALKKPERRFWNILFNPEGNIFLAKQTLVQQFAEELEEPTLTTTALITQLARSEISNLLTEHSPRVVCFQYQLKAWLAATQELTCLFQSGDIPFYAD